MPTFTKEWCLRAAARDEGEYITAGVPYCIDEPTILEEISKMEDEFIKRFIASQKDPDPKIIEALKKGFGEFYEQGFE